MQLAFYLAKYGDYQDKLIAWATGGKYSHVELIFKTGEWFSSSTRDGGVRFKKIMPNPEHWDYTTIEVSDSQEFRMYVWCESQVGKPYDWFGAIIAGSRFSIKKQTNTRSKWFCSEICGRSLIMENLIQSKTDQITPNCLWNYLTNTKPNL
jgi:uncharacterized protein YycO